VFHNKRKVHGRDTCYYLKRSTLILPKSTPSLRCFSFIHTWETSYRGFLKKNEKKLVRSFNFTFRYTDGVLAVNNYRLSDFLGCIYPIEIERKDITDTYRSASYLDLHLEIDSEVR
jgi:hypothetical protein